MRSSDRFAESPQAPTYHSTVPNAPLVPPSRTITGLPPPTYAPGFHRAPTGNANKLSHMDFNISEWSAARSGPRARHYQNVANRRTSLARLEENTRLTALASSMTFPSLRAPFAIDTEATNARSTGTIAEEEQAPEGGGVQQSLPPLEDPDLVGVEAANVARERRLYMAKCKDEEALRQESKSWDFMLAQMADWQSRERSWERFQRERKNSGLGSKIFKRFWK